MASEKNITMRQYNGVDYDTLYPKTKVEQVEGAYTQQQILADSTKGLYGLDSGAAPDDVLALLKTLVSNAQVTANHCVRVEIVTRTGTGATNTSKGVECSLTFSGVPDMVIAMYAVGSNGYGSPYYFGGENNQYTGRYCMYPKALRVGDYSGGTGAGFSYNDQSAGQVSSDRRTVKWQSFNSNPSVFLNMAGKTYWFAALYFNVEE